MANRTRDKDPPQWFGEKDYRGLYADLAKSGAQRWLYELRERDFALKEAERGAKGEPSFAETLKKDWGSILGEDLEDYRPGIITPEPVWVVEPDRVRPTGKPFEVLVRSRQPQTLLIEVWPGATDADLIKGFRNALTEIRKTHPAPVTRRGPRAMTARFDEAVFHRWQKHRILEIADLLAWSIQEDVKIGAARIGEWLFPSVTASAKRGQEAITVLQEALASIPALTAQIAKSTN